MKKELQYEGDFMRLLNAWKSKNFKARGFIVSLELPGPPKYREEDTEKERELARLVAKNFRICITPSIQSKSRATTHSISSSSAAPSAIFDDPFQYETGPESASELDVSEQFATKAAKKPPARHTFIKDLPFPDLPPLCDFHFEGKLPALRSRNEEGYSKSFRVNRFIKSCRRYGKG